MDVRVGPKRRLSSEELMLLNCGVGVPGAGILHIECRTFHSINFQDLE